MMRCASIIEEATSSRFFPDFKQPFQHDALYGAVFIYSNRVRGNSGTSRARSWLRISTQHDTEDQCAFWGLIILPRGGSSNIVTSTDIWITEFRTPSHSFLIPPHSYSLNRSIAHDLPQNIVENDEGDNKINRMREKRRHVSCLKGKHFSLAKTCH